MKTLKSKKGGKIVAIFFNIRDQIKLYHWQTKSFAEHKATDDLIGKLDTNIDMFVEAYMGRYGRPRLGQTYPVKNLTVSGIRAFIARSDEWLTSKLPHGPRPLRLLRLWPPGGQQRNGSSGGRRRQCRHCGGGEEAGQARRG